MTTPDPACSPAPAPASAPRTAAHPRRGLVLACGFGATVAMWALGYLAMMGAGLVVGELLFVLTLLCLVAAGFVAGRYGRGTWRTGLGVGFTSGLLNFLIVGALIEGDTPMQRATNALLWGAGAVVVSMMLAGIGAAIGRRVAGHHSDEPTPGAWYARFAMIAAAAAFLLLITGGLVTGLEAGLAVPDWPNTFGHNMLLYPLSEMTGGVYYEHAHRLYGMLVGATILTLAATLLRFDHRGWLKAFGLLVLVMVIAQGVMGGLRVDASLSGSVDFDATRPNLALAIVHGVFGQVVFASVVAIAAFLAPTWRRPMEVVQRASVRSDRQAAVALVVILLVQLVLGALYRHLNGQFEEGHQMTFTILTTHIMVAMVVTILALFAGGRAMALYPQQPIVRRTGTAVAVLVAVQLLLGVGALIAVLAGRGAESIPMLEVVVTTAHQATGALLLSGATLLMLWTHRVLTPDVQAEAPSPQRGAAELAAAQ